MAMLDIERIESIIGYKFKNKHLLKTCFTHSSYANEHGQTDNERLEFFGDSIMEFIVTEYLYKKGMGNEGVMTRIRAELVSKEPLHKVVFNLGLNEYVLLGNGQGRSANKEEKLYSSVYEALVAGIYLDGGIVPVRKFIKDTLISYYLTDKKDLPKAKTKFLYKVELQEYVQKRKLGILAYQSLSKKGPDHNPEFVEAVTLNGQVLGEGVGKSKQSAQNNAAKVALEKIKQGG